MIFDRIVSEVPEISCMRNARHNNVAGIFDGLFTRSFSEFTYSMCSPSSNIIPVFPNFLQKYKKQKKDHCAKHKAGR